MFRFSAFFRSQSLYFSTIGAHGARTNNLMVDYLINSLQFSKPDAISAASKSKVTHLKSTVNSDLVVKTLKDYGLNIAQIRDIVSSFPQILTCKASQTLEPKIRVFQELGLSGSDLVSLVKKDQNLFRHGLHTSIVPGIAFLRELLGSNEKVIQVINRSRWLCVNNCNMKRLSKNVSILRDYGVSDERIFKLLVSYPERLIVKPELLECKMDYVEGKLGISRESPGFMYALGAVLWSSDSEIEKKIGVFRSYGWSDSEISLLVKVQPNCLSKSETNIREKLDFFVNELGYAPAYMIRCNSFFSCSLEKRVIPRNTILKILKEKKLVNENLPLVTVISYTESKFLGFLRSFESDMPSLCETYLNSLRRVSKVE